MTNKVRQHRERLCRLLEDNKIHYFSWTRRHHHNRSATAHLEYLKRIDRYLPGGNNEKMGAYIDELYAKEYSTPSETPKVATSDGSSADYYELPAGATQLQDLISHKDMNAQIGEIFRSSYRYGESSHSDQLRDARKIHFYINAEITRLEKLQ